jgi:tetratricopeptide (TPR) repeat protein
MGIYDKAYEYAEKAYALDSSNLDIARIYAWTLSSLFEKNKNKNKNALEIIDKVIKLRQNGITQTVLSKENDRISEENLLADLNVRSHILYRLELNDKANHNIDYTIDLFPKSKLPKYIQ